LLHCSQAATHKDGFSGKVEVPVQEAFPELLLHDRWKAGQNRLELSSIIPLQGFKVHLQDKSLFARHLTEILIKQGLHPQEIFPPLLQIKEFMLKEIIQQTTG
jgi:hypothetical protein